jgi:hypothetical protein
VACSGQGSNRTELSLSFAHATRGRKRRPPGHLKVTPRHFFLRLCRFYSTQLVPHTGPLGPCTVVTILRPPIDWSLPPIRSMPIMGCGVIAQDSCKR